MTTSPLVLGPILRYVDEVSASIWVETRASATVTVSTPHRSTSARTFAVHGHHYSLVHVGGLAPGTVTPYSVEVDGTRAWPDIDSSLPASVISTLEPGRPLRLSFGSCRTSVPHDKTGNRTHGVDALRAFALQLAAGDRGTAQPDLMLFLGDQVYADSTSTAMQEFIAARRDIHEPPGKELADYEEYAHLYRLAWSDEANRWLLSTVPCAMIFDDHDVRDDWNASLSWKRTMEAKPWWHGRIVAGLASYWVHQHQMESWDEAISEGAWDRAPPPSASGCGRPSTSSIGAHSRGASGRWPRWRRRWPTASAARHPTPWPSSPAPRTSPTFPGWRGRRAAASFRRCARLRDRHEARRPARPRGGGRRSAVPLVGHQRTVVRGDYLRPESKEVAAITLEPRGSHLASPPPASLQ